MYKQVVQKIDVKVEQQEIGKYQDRALTPSNDEKPDASAKNYAENLNTFLHSTDPAEAKTAGNYLVSQGERDKYGNLFQPILGKNEYGSYTEKQNLPGTSGRKQAEALIGILGKTPADSEKIMKYYLELSGDKDISKTKARSGGAPKKKEEGSKTKKDTSKYNTAD